MREVRFDVEGESVAGKLWEPAAGEAAGQLVLVHGLLSQAAEFGDLGASLAERGWRVLAIDQRGFGASGGPRGIIVEERATADVLAAVAWLRKDEPELPTGLVGHSMGAVFTLAALAQDPTLKAGVLAAPMRTIRAELKDAEFFAYQVGNVISQLKTRLGLGPLIVPYKYDYDRLFKDKEAARRAREQAFLVRKVNLSNYDAFLAMDSEENARRVRQPVLVMLADHDQAVRRENSLAVYHALAGPKELATIDSGHSVWTDAAAADAVTQVDRWMRRHLAS